MSENKLPVLWVPPVPPQAPEDRPPRAGRRPQIVTLAALLIGTPILAWATMTGNDEPIERTAVATVAEATAKPVVPPAAKAPAPEAQNASTPKAEKAPPPEAQNATPPAPVRLAGTATSAGPATSGGSQPYLTDAPAAAKAQPEAKPAKDTAAAPAAVDAEGHPVRVIDMNQRSDGDAAVEPKPVTPPVATATPQPTAEKPDAAKAVAADAKATTPPHRPAPAAAKDEPKPPVTPPTPVAAKAEPSPVAAKDPTPNGLRSTLDAPSVAAPKPTDGAAARDASPGHAREIAAKPTPEKPITAKPATVTTAPKPASGPTSVVTVAPPATPKTPTKIPEPRPRDTVPALAGGPDAAARAESRDFADRLAAVRRDEGRRLRAAPPPIDDEEVVVVPRRGWSIFPSFEDEAPARPVLRPFEAPPRVAERPVSHSNCHFHAWPTEEMEFHRDVQCHWHRNARDTSLRYVR